MKSQGISLWKTCIILFLCYDTNSLKEVFLQLFTRSHRLTVRTAGFHPVNRGSTPRGITLHTQKTPLFRVSFEYKKHRLHLRGIIGTWKLWFKRFSEGIHGSDSLDDSSCRIPVGNIGFYLNIRNVLPIKMMLLQQNIHCGQKFLERFPTVSNDTAFKQNIFFV